MCVCVCVCVATEEIEGGTLRQRYAQLPLYLLKLPLNHSSSFAHIVWRSDVHVAPYVWSPFFLQGTMALLPKRYLMIPELVIFVCELCVRVCVSVGCVCVCACVCVCVCVLKCVRACSCVCS